MIEHTTSGPVGVLRLDNPPAHALSGALIAELEERLRALERDPPGALVLTASGGRFFSAGLDLTEVDRLERPAFEAFLDRFIGAVLWLFRFPRPVVAAVNGHAVAGGAILALAAERRIAARGPALFGLNEVQVGVPLPGPLFEVVRSALGAAQAAEVLLEGRNLDVDGALRAGFANEAVEPADLERRAVALAAKLERIPRAAYGRMKALLRAEAEERIARAARDDPFVDIWFSPEARRAREAACAALLAKKGPK
ncbi:MAG: enoyl-CoA hydratase/isomerase family protein [Planctomycetes bacterium]|nr:enoyl-CoA hydratase/isomerase family protein [Planctomycetota bacterium]